MKLHQVNSQCDSATMFSRQLCVNTRSTHYCLVKSTLINFDFVFWFLDTSNLEVLKEFFNTTRVPMVLSLFENLLYDVL